MANQIENVLVILDYLLKYTDEDHKSSEKDIQEYAKANYNLQIDHRSICGVLNKLKNYCDLYPNSFPFILESNDTTRPKFYIEQKHFNDEEIISIGSAIKNDPFSSKEMSNELLSKFIEASTSVHKQQHFKNIIDSGLQTSAKVSESTAKKISKLKYAIANKCMVEYETKFAYDKQFTHCIDYPYKLIEVDSVPHVLMYHDNGLISVKISSMKKMVAIESLIDGSKAQLKIKNYYKGPFNSLDEDANYKRISDDSSSPTLCEFTFPNDPYDIQTVCESFKYTFGEDLTYIVDGDRCIAKAKCFGQLFILWCTKYEIFRLIKVIGPNSLRLLLCLNLMHD